MTEAELSRFVVNQISTLTTFAPAAIVADVQGFWTSLRKEVCGRTTSVQIAVCAVWSYF